MVLEPNYHTTKFFAKKLLDMEMRKTQTLMNKPVYFGLLILDLSNTIFYELLYDYVKPKYNKKRKLFYMDTDIFIVYLKTDDIYKDITEDL